MRDLSARPRKATINGGLMKTRGEEVSHHGKESEARRCRDEPLLMHDFRELMKEAMSWKTARVIRPSIPLERSFPLTIPARVLPRAIWRG
jgi:hypothetical protein